MLYLFQKFSQMNINGNQGQETTANTLSFCFLEMGKNNEIYKK